MSKYKLKDVVMALDNGKVYEAKVLKTHHLGSNYKYFIHFQGWAPKHDVWVNEELLSAKDDPVGMKLLEDQINGISQVKPTKKGKRPLNVETIQTVGIDDVPEPVLDAEAMKQKARADVLEAQFRKRRKQLSMKDLVENEDPAITAKLNIPLAMKKFLVDEWGLITNENSKLLKLPGELTAEKAIKDYVTEKTNKLKSADLIEEYEELFLCLKSYFDLALPSILLYRQERDQFDALQAAAVSKYGCFTPSKVYGVEHLLRFFVRMPRLMDNLFLPEKDVNEIVSKFVDFMGFLNTHITYYFDISEYAPVEEALKHIETWKTSAESSATSADKPKTGRKKSAKSVEVAMEVDESASSKSSTKEEEVEVVEPKRKSSKTPTKESVEMVVDVEGPKTRHLSSRRK